MTKVFRFTGLFMPPGGGLGPEPPTPTPTMRFYVQPTDTEAGELFEPAVVVRLSNNAHDTLTIFSANCTDIVPVTVQAGSSGAVFTGLRAGSTPAEGCRLTVRNNSNPSMPDVVSNPFNVVAPAIVWELIARGSANLSQGLGATLNTTGANLIIMTLVGASVLSVPGLLFTDSFGQSATRLTPFGVGTWFELQSAVWLPPFQTGPTHSLWVQGTVSTNFPGVNILAFHAPNPILRIEGTSYGNAIDSATSIQSLTAAIIDFPNALVVSGFGTTPVVTPPTGYGIETLPGVPGVNFDVVTGYRIVNGPATERPLWQSEQGNLRTNLIVFQGGA